MQLKSDLKSCYNNSSKSVTNCSLTLTKFNKSSTVAEMGDRGHNRHGPKRGRRLLYPFRGGGAGSPSNTMWPGRYCPYQLASSSIQCLATIDMGRKLGGSCAFFSGELVPLLTQSCLGRGLPPYQVAS